MLGLSTSIHVKILYTRLADTNGLARISPDSFNNAEIILIWITVISLVSM